MKRVKRSAKDGSTVSSKGLSQPFLIGAATLTGALLLVLVASLWAANTTHKQLQNLWVHSELAALNQSLQTLSADLAAAASQPRLQEALRDNNTLAQHQLEQDLAFRAYVLDAYLTPKGRVQLTEDRAAPINFAALDMLKRAEQGQTTPAEIYRIGNRWVLYQAQAVKSPDDQLLGTLLFAVDLVRIMPRIQTPERDLGRLELVQQFARTQAQVLVSSGVENSSSWQEFPTQTPHLSLRLQASQAPWPGTQWLAASLLALLAGLCGLWLALSLTQKRLQQKIQDDAAQLQQLLRESAHGKAVKAFSLNLAPLNALASEIAQRSIAAPTKTAAKAPEPTAIGTNEVLDMDFLDDTPDFLGLDEEPTMTQHAPDLPQSIFRAYDIRGIIGQTLTPETAYWIGRAVGSQSLAEGEPHVSVGRDGRLSGPVLAERLIQGLLDCGCQVTDIGLVPTPALYYAANTLAGRSGVMITGSHNPPDYNGFKIMIAGDTLANEQIQALYQRICSHDLSTGSGSLETVEILESYYARIRDDIALVRPLKVVVDCGNGAAAVIAPQLIEALGCTVIPLFCDVDGTFPNHHPDPGKPENLVDLIAAVKAHQADVGLAFDGDGDRVGVVTNQGSIVYPDRLLMLFAKDVITRNPGADVIFDVKCSRRLPALIEQVGGRPVMWKTGHSLIKKKMRETGALLAGEMSGHIFFKERWYGFDDGIYAAARLLEILSAESQSAEDIFQSFANDVSTPEINIEVTEHSKFSIIEALQAQGQWADGNVSTLDGVRVDYPTGWGLVRASNTTPVLVLRFEAETADELARIQDVFRAQLYTVAPDLTLPF